MKTLEVIEPPRSFFYSNILSAMDSDIFSLSKVAIPSNFCAIHVRCSTKSYLSPHNSACHLFPAYNFSTIICSKSSHALNIIKPTMYRCRETASTLCSFPDFFTFDSWELGERKSDSPPKNIIIPSQKKNISLIVII